MSRHPLSAKGVRLVTTETTDPTPLPELSVTAEQAARIMAAFESDAAYRQWLRKQLREYVIQHELEATDAQYHATRQQVVESVAATLPEEAAS